jgi:hypothetical protein
VATPIAVSGSGRKRAPSALRDRIADHQNYGWARYDDEHSRSGGKGKPGTDVHEDGDDSIEGAAI